MFFVLTNQFMRVEKHLCRRAEMNAMLGKVDSFLFVVPYEGGFAQIEFKGFV